MNKAVHLILYTIIFICLGLLFFDRYNGEKIVYVDANKIVNDYQGMRNARKMFQEQSAIWKSNIDTLKNELDSEINRHQSSLNSMTKKEKELSEKLLKNKQQQLVSYQNSIQQMAQSQEAKLSDDVFKEINAFLKTYGKNKNYRIILATTDYGNIAYADEDLNITNEVLELLNKGYTAK